MKQEETPNGNQAPGSQAHGYFQEIGSVLGLDLSGPIIPLNSTDTLAAKATRKASGRTHVKLMSADGLNSAYMIEDEARALLSFLKMVLEPEAQDTESAVSEGVGS